MGIDKKYQMEKCRVCRFLKRVKGCTQDLPAEEEMGTLDKIYTCIYDIKNYSKFKTTWKKNKSQIRLE